MTTDPLVDCANALPASCRYVGDNIPETPYDQPIEAPETTTQYKPLGLTQVCEIAAYVENKPADWPDDYDMAQSAVTIWKTAGYDPADVRQAAEEALENLRKD